MLPARIDARYYLDLFGLLKNSLFDPRHIDGQQFADFLIAAPACAVLFEGANAASRERARLLIQAIGWLFQDYESRLQNAGLLDFDDQKLRPYMKMVADPELSNAVQQQWSHVIVDEFQDINRLDFELIRIISKRAALAVTGDDDQAIYGFRGCTPEYIINLEKHLDRKVASFELQINYRCPPNIVARADQLIRHNKWRIAKTPIAHRTDPSVIKVVRTERASIEARSIVAFIHRVREARPTLGWSDFAVLYRTNAQSLPLQVELVLHDVPYQVRRQDNLLTNETLDRILAILKVKQQGPEGSRDLESEFKAVVAHYFSVPLRNHAAIRAGLRGATSLRSAASNPEFLGLLPETREGSLASALETVWKIGDLQQLLLAIPDRFRGVRGLIGSLEDAIDQKVPLGEMFDLAQHSGGSLDEFVSLIDRAMTRARSTQAGEDKEGVNLLTYFKSKGRQWHTVILTTCNEGLIPHSRAPVEDERRLFYVALTRASANLLISYVSSSLGKKVAPSRFLSEGGLL